MMTNKKLKTIVKEFLSADEDSSTIGSKYKDIFLNKRQKFINTMMSNKRELVKRYGKDAEKVAVGRAVKDAKNYIEKMKQQDLKELVRKTLQEEPVKEDNTFSKEYDNNPALKGKQQDLPDALQKAIIKKEKGSMEEDIEVGHTDNEPHMIKGELYQIGKYAMELYAALEEMEEQGGEYDFPAWWQSKITTAKDMISGAKHYLEFELNEPKIDAFVDKLTGFRYKEFPFNIPIIA